MPSSEQQTDDALITASSREDIADDYPKMGARFRGPTIHLLSKGAATPAPSPFTASQPE